METRYDIPEAPAVPEVEGALPARQRESFERLLREEKIPAPLRRWLRRPDRGEDPDHYEPQRLTRKICWQYDGSARKVPFLRRPYI